MAEIKRIFFGEVKKGKVSLWDKAAYLVNLAKLEGQEVQLTISKRQKRRTLNQNSYLFGVVYQTLYETIKEIINDSTGYESVDEVHEALKWEYLRVERGHGLPPTVRSTTDLSTAEFSDYVDRIKRDAARGKFGGPSEGIYIPDAGESFQ